ncbi:antitoxin VbhA family protein [Hymenobacter sp. BT683]|uniref:Antitoxin VbhA family protein n=1 Tax=Hymenobacter jeongseonensis TaxID=2791027 RepID=A0ABS0IMY6_9BACT|nr:antitoxin VbhA family protein [Hymenobacter jeongseonensis]
MPLFLPLLLCPGAADPARAHRVREVENAVLSQIYEGYPPSPAAWAQLCRYVAGEVSREEGFRGLYTHYTAARRGRGGPPKPAPGSPA